MTVYLLYNTATNNETVLEAVVSDESVAKRWAKHFGNHYHQYELDRTDEIAWALKENTDG